MTTAAADLLTTYPDLVGHLSKDIFFEFHEIHVNYWQIKSITLKMK